MEIKFHKSPATRGKGGRRRWKKRDVLNIYIYIPAIHLSQLDSNVVIFSLEFKLGLFYPMALWKSVLDNRHNSLDKQTSLLRILTILLGRFQTTALDPYNVKD